MKWTSNNLKKEIIVLNSEHKVSEEMKLWCLLLGGIVGLTKEIRGSVMWSRRLNILCIALKIIALFIITLRVGILLTCRKHLHDRIVSLRGGIWTQKKPRFLLKCLYHVRVMYVCASFYDFDIWIVPTVTGIKLMFVTLVTYIPTWRTRKMAT